MLRFCEHMAWSEYRKSELSNLISLAENFSRQLRGWADALQNSEIKGQKYLTDATRDAAMRKTRVAAFLEKLERIRTGAEHEGSPAEPLGIGASDASSTGRRGPPGPPIDHGPWPLSPDALP